MWALTASGETGIRPGSAASSHLCDVWAPDTMSPWTAAPISVPTISMVNPGTERGLKVTELAGPRAAPSPTLIRCPRSRYAVAESRSLGLGVKNMVSAV